MTQKRLERHPRSPAPFLIAAQWNGHSPIWSGC